MQMRTALFAALSLIVSAPKVKANHGPGTSGGGNQTASGETLKAGKFDLSLREDYTRFDHIGQDEAERRASRSGGFDALEYASLTSISLSYGITNDLQAGAQIGYYHGSNFIDAESDGVDAESGTADPEGVSDLWLTAKFRVLRGEYGNVALLAGVKLPTGRHNIQLDNGELLEASSQPGTGSFDFQLGAAWSRFLTPRITADASAMYTLRTEHDDFKVGDRLDLGLAAAYRLTESIKQFPNYIQRQNVLLLPRGMP